MVGPFSRFLRCLCLAKVLFGALQQEVDLLAGGPLPPQRVTAASMTMLGVLEASAELRAGRVHDLEITGDVIAPFAVLDAVCRRCEGLPAGSPALGAAVLGALTRPGAFVLGVLDLGELVRRLA